MNKTCGTAKAGVRDAVAGGSRAAASACAVEWGVDIPRSASVSLPGGYLAKAGYSRLRPAVAALRALHEQPDVQLLFLDIQMPDLSGLELARVLRHGPRVIFTTAFNQYALEGFRVDALDYLLKPFNYEEFLRAALKAGPTSN